MVEAMTRRGERAQRSSTDGDALVIGEHLIGGRRTLAAPRKDRRPRQVAQVGSALDVVDVAVRDEYRTQSAVRVRGIQDAVEVALVVRAGVDDDTARWLLRIPDEIRV